MAQKRANHHTPESVLPGIQPVSALRGLVASLLRDRSLRLVAPRTTRDGSIDGSGERKKPDVASTLSIEAVPDVFAVSPDLGPFPPIAVFRRADEQAGDKAGPDRSDGA